MIKLEEKKVTRQDIIAFKEKLKEIAAEQVLVKKVNNKKKMSKRKPVPQIPIDYLLENVFIMRLLGWTVTMGRKISHEYINGFSDVVQFSKSVGKDQAILYKGRNK